jgi:hypothetical protein
MAQQDRSTIKTFFETGDIPTEAQFGDSFDSQVFWVDDVETDLTSNSDDKVPTVKAVVDGIAAIPNELTTDELAAINGANSPDATNVFLTEDDEVYTKDANDNIFYKGVTPTLGTSCSKNIFHKTGGAITLGNAAIGNIFEPTENTTNFVFGANLRNVTIKAGNYPSSPSAGTLNLTAGGYAFLYNKDYPSEIFVGANGAALHSYYDSANDRYVVTNLVTLVSINIGGGGTVTSVNAGTNISVTGTAAAPIINSLSDRYKTTSLSSVSIGNGSKTFTVDANLSYISQQEVLIVYDASNHMHGTVTSYNSTTGQLIVDVKHHTGGGTFASWVINLDGVPIDAITGAGTLNRLAYFTAAQVIDDVAAITASRALISDANGLPTHSATTSTELGYVSGVTSAIQTQIDIARRSSIFFAPSAINPVDSTTYYFSSALGIGTTATSFDLNLGYAFRVIGATIQAFNNSGTVGSNEDSTLQLRNTTAGTSSSIGTFKTNAAALAQTEVTYTGLNISVAATDLFALQWDFPTATTNPTNVFIRVNLLIQFT